MMPKRFRSLTVLTFLIVGASFTTQYTPALAAKVKLKVMFKSDTTNIRVSKARIAAFERSHPNIKIVPEYNASGQNPTDRLLLQLSSGVAPDVAAIDFEPVELALKNLLLPLESFIKSDKQVQSWQYMHPRQLKEFTYNGKLYALPEGLCPYVIYWDIPMFAQVGLANPPKALKGPEWEDWTVDRFISYGKKLTRDTNGDGKLDRFGWDAWGFSQPDAYTPWVWMQGADLFKVDPKSGLATESNLADPKVIEGLQLYADLKNKYQIYGSSFDNGRAGMYHAGRWFVPDYQGKLKFDYDLAPMPHLPGKPSSHLALLRPRGAILRGTKHPKEAWEFLKFIAAPEQEQITWDSGAVTNIPIFRNSKIMDKFLKNSPPHSNQLFIEIGTNEYSRCSWDNKVPKNWSEIISTMGTQLSQVWNGKASASQVCTSLEKQVTRILKR